MKNLVFISIIATTFCLASCGNSTSNKTSAESAKSKTENTSVTTETTAPNQLSQKETADGWQLLFDGTTSEGWRSYGKTTFPNGWIIENGTISCMGSGRGEAGAKEGGDIIYNKKFSDFHLKLEWKISEGGNSGIFYLGQEQPDLDYIWKTAPEMQILDNAKHPDSDLGKNGNRKAGSLYDLIPANPQNAQPAGKWNAIEIICYKGTVVHKMNGETVVEYHLWTPEWEKLVSGSKFPKLNENWANVAKEGYIGVQDHGDDVWFRNIKIKEL